MNKECQATQSLLERYLDQELAEKESTVIRDHLGCCQDCREQLEIYQKTRTLLQATSHRSTDTVRFEQLWPRIEQAIKSRSEPSVMTRVFSRMYPVPLAALVILVLLIGTIWFLSRPTGRVSMAGKIQEQLGQDLQAYSLLRSSMAEEIKTFQVQLEALKRDHLKTASPQAAARRQEELGQVIRDHGHRRFQQSRTAGELQERVGTGIRDSAHLRYLMVSSQSTPDHRPE